jgi:hypothetical protein
MSPAVLEINMAPIARSWHQMAKKREIIAEKEPCGTGF